MYLNFISFSSRIYIYIPFEKLNTDNESTVIYLNCPRCVCHSHNGTETLSIKLWVQQQEDETKNLFRDTKKIAYCNNNLLCTLYSYRTHIGCVITVYL